VFARRRHTISHIDFGGGLGIPYHPDTTPPPEPAAYCRHRQAGDARSRLHADVRARTDDRRNAAFLVTRVIYVKHGEARNFVIVDAAMNDLIRPTLYEAYHDLLPVRLAEPGASLDRRRRGRTGLRKRRLSRADRSMPEPSSGDLLAVMTAAPTARCRPQATTPARWCRKCWSRTPVRRGGPRVEVDALIAMDKSAPWL